MLICNFLKVSVIFVVKTFYSYLQMFDLKQSRFVRPPPPSLSQTRLMFPTHWLQLGGIPRYVNSRKSIDVATHFVIFFIYIYILSIRQSNTIHDWLSGRLTLTVPLLSTDSHTSSAEKQRGSETFSLLYMLATDCGAIPPVNVGLLVPLL